MKEKTSVTLSPEVLAGIDRLAGSRLSRSAFIEDVLRRYLKEEARARRNAREIQLLNRAADELGAEILDTLDYQAPWD
jgi:metal-responsive CopG/Arc/MetJ family transcriptional regulator